MLRKSIAIAVAVSMMFVSIFSIISLVGGESTFHVDDNYNQNTDGWGITHFDTIQDAVDNAENGDTIIVHSGRYIENVVVDKTLKLEGDGSPEINGGGSGTVVTITGDNVQFAGFDVKNSGTGTTDAGILIDAEGTVVKDNYIAGNNLGIRLRPVEGSGWTPKWEDTTYLNTHPNGMDIQDDEMVAVHYNGKIIVRGTDDGDPVWNALFKGGKEAKGVAFDSNHNIAVVGGQLMGLNNYRWIMEYYNDDSTHSLKWCVDPGFSGQSLYGYDVVFDGSDNLIVAGKGGNHHPTIAKFKSTDGSKIWQYNDDNGGQVSVGFWDVAADPSGNFVAGGCVQGVPTTAKITKVNPNGNRIWSKTIGSDNSEVLAVAVDSTGNILAGVADYKEDKVLLRKYDSSGNVKWTDINFGSEEKFTLYYKSIASYNDDKWIVHGYSNMKDENVVYLLDASGNILSKYFTGVEYRDIHGELKYDADGDRIAISAHAGDGDVWNSVWERGSPVPATVENNIITQNIYGVYLEGSGTEINHNDITENTYAVQNTGDTAADLQFNWWGDASGPSGAGPGTGDSISLNVDYSPWLGFVEGTSPMTFHTNDVIQDAVSEAVGGDTVIVYDGTYTEQVVIDKDLVLKTGSSPKILAPDYAETYTFDESGSAWQPVVIAYGGTEVNGHISGIGTVRVTITGFEIDGGNKADTARFAGILLRNVNSGLVYENSLHSFYNPGGDGTGPESFGISVIGNSYVTMTDNDIRGFSRGGIVVRGDGTYPDSIGSYPDPTAIIKNNDVYGNGLETGSTWWAENGIQVGWAATGTIIGNRVYDCRVNSPDWTASGISSYYGVVDEISENIVENCDLGIAVNYNDEAEIEKNELYRNDFGFVIVGGSANQIHHNTIEDNVFTGMYLCSDSNAIHHNTFDMNGEAGIFAEEAEKNNIHHNKFNVNDGFGIFLYYSDDNTVNNNHAFKNGMEGICVEASDDNSVTFNNAFSNGEYGIRVTDDRYWVPPVMMNEEEIPGYWEIVETSDGNKIQHNVAHFNGEADLFDDTEGTNNVWSKNTYDDSIPENL